MSLQQAASASAQPRCRPCCVGSTHVAQLHLPHRITGRRQLSASAQQLPNLSSRRQRRKLYVQALDAAQTFYFAHIMKEKAEPKKLLKIGIVGFGTFGQFIAKRLVQQGHSVLATSRTPYLQEAQSLGVDFYTGRRSPQMPAISGATN
jgi:lactate dehydrogenase-like 2-hydroxyacid dehydrogenase